MPDRRDALTPERLAQLLDKLNEVMTEAERLRREVSQQLDDQRRTVQQRVSQEPARPTAARKRATKAR
jgi:hypothetical protein